MARTRNAERFDAQREQILAASADCFVRLGLRGASISDICEAAGGISPGRLYHYFPSRKAIVEALVTEERATIAALFAARPPHISPRLALTRLLRQALDLMLSDAHAVLTLDIIAEATRDPDVGRIVAYAERDYRERLIVLLAAIREAGGGWLPGQDNRLARMITMVVEGAAVRAVAEQRSRRSLVKEALSTVDAILDQATT